MDLLRKVQNRVRGLKQRWGSEASRRELWNKEFTEGRWDNIEDTSGDVVYRFIEKYAGQGSILDMGCGSGNTSCELAFESYTEYLGVDISDVALEKARTKSRALKRETKNTYQRGDIESFAPSKPHNVILFRESIYYVPRPRIKTVLDRYSGFLTQTGVLIIRLHDKAQGAGMLPLLESGRQVIERHEPEAGPLILVLR